MGQLRTLLNKNISNTRRPSQKSGTKHRRVIFGTAIDNGTLAVIYSYHTTKGRVRFRVVPSFKTAAADEVAE